MILTPRSALKVHEPYISHKIADSHFTRASFVTEGLVSQNGTLVLRILASLVSDNSIVTLCLYRKIISQYFQNFLVQCFVPKKEINRLESHIAGFIKVHQYSDPSIWWPRPRTTKSWMGVAGGHDACRGREFKTPPMERSSPWPCNAWYCMRSRCTVHHR